MWGGGWGGGGFCGITRETNFERRPFIIFLLPLVNRLFWSSQYSEENIIQQRLFHSLLIVSTDKST